MGIMHSSSNKISAKGRLVYHYCNLDVFKEIIKTASLRMTNIAKSNDSSEIKHALNIIEKVLFHICTDEALALQNEHLPDFINSFDFAVYFNQLIEESNLSYYAICFSKNSDLLSQWRGYANSGNGVAIGFDNRFFNSLLDQRTAGFSFEDIHYTEDDLATEIRSLFLKGLEKLKGQRAILRSDYENIFLDIALNAIYLAAFYKNAAFQEESEKRLVYYPFGNISSLQKRTSRSDDISNNRYLDRMMDHFGSKNIHSDFLLSSPDFLIRGNQIVSYIDLSIEKEKHSSISEIVLGPKTDIDDNDLRLFLLSNGYDLNYINIHKSTAPFR